MKYGLVLAVVTLALAGVASAASAPAVRLTSTDPVVVQGAGFRAKERIRVSVVTPAEVWRRTIVATRAGAFRLEVDGVPLGRCGFNVRAVGSRGSKAMLRKLPLPACMP